jgi:hypothetical protein
MVVHFGPGTRPSDMGPAGQKYNTSAESGHDVHLEQHYSRVECELC